MGRLREIVFDCGKPSAMARFWAAAIDGYSVRPYDDAEIARLAEKGLTPETDPVVMVDGPGPVLCFQHVRERRYEGNRLHLDISVADRRSEVVRLSSLGASLWREVDGYSVMLDPEGNQFCLVQDR